MLGDTVQLVGRGLTGAGRLIEQAAGGDRGARAATEAYDGRPPSRASSPPVRSPARPAGARSPARPTAGNGTGPQPGGEGSPESTAAADTTKTGTPEPQPRRGAEDDPVPAHVDEEPTLVAEFADGGAEAGAGAQVHVEEPWPGYTGLRAREIADRLVAVPESVLSLVVLYEQSARARSSVIDAAQRELARRG